MFWVGIAFPDYSLASRPSFVCVGTRLECQESITKAAEEAIAAGKPFARAVVDPVANGIPVRLPIARPPEAAGPQDAPVEVKKPKGKPAGK